MGDYKTAPNSIIDYAGTCDKSFDAMAFNNADGLILSELSYLKLNTKNLKNYGYDIALPTAQSSSNGLKKSITVEELYNIYKNDNSVIGERNVSHTKDIALLEKMASNDRFKDMEISNYCLDPVTNGDTRFSSIGNGESVEQFAAVTIKYNGSDGNPHNFVSFRGTNGTHEGWAEDFEMIYTGTTQAQLDSATYLNIVGGKMGPNEKIDLGGHSKGGNDDEYGFLHCDQSVADKVTAIYGYDSPGVNNDSITDPARYDKYLQLSDRHHVCPEDSIVGQLLHEHGDSIYVKNVESGFGEHDPFSWYVDPTNGSFTECKQSAISRALDDILDTTVPTLSPSERKAVFEFADAATRVIFNNENDKPKTAAEQMLNIANLVDSFKDNKLLLTSIGAKMALAAGYVGSLHLGAAIINGVTGGHITADNISDFIDCSADTIEEYCNDLRDMWETGMDTLKEGWETVKETASGIGEAAVNTWNDITEGAGNLIDSGMDFLSSHNPFSKKSSGPSGHSSSSHGGGGHHRSGGGSGSGGGILSGVMNKLREDFNVLRHGADDLLGYDIILDEEAFAKAASDFEDLADQIKQLRKDIEEQLEMLQHGFDTPAGHKFIDSCRNNLLRPLEEQQIVVEHISETLHKCINEYQSVFNEYSELTALIASD